jgi:hypothetical protein
MRSLACAISILVCACASPPPVSDLAFVTRDPEVVNPRILRQEVEGEWCFTQNIVTVSLRPPWRVRLADTGRAISLSAGVFRRRRRRGACRMKAIGLLLFLAAASSMGCVTYERGTFAAASATIVPIEMTTVAENVEGKACGDLFQAPVARAIDAALRSPPGANALVGVTIGFEQLCVIVRGTAVRVP